MASTQQVPAMLSNDEKAIFEKVIAAAKDKSAMEVKGQVVTNGNLVNTIKDKAVLRIIDQHNWSGKPVPLYPEVLPFGEVVQFEHRGPLPGGCKGGVVYADGTDSTARKWLVAFHIPNNEYHHSGDKVVFNFPQLLSFKFFFCFFLFFILFYKYIKPETFV